MPISPTDISLELQHSLEWLSPIEEVDGLWFKREDKYAPGGEGGINGSKLRQLIWMMTRLDRGEVDTVLSAANPRSPQIIMGSVVSALLGLKFIQVLGLRSPEAALKFSYVQAAARLGAIFRYGVKPGYDSSVEGALKRIQERTPRSWAIPHAIAPQPHEVREFHELGALQVRNLPAVRNLIIPHGSTNSAASILLGLHTYNIEFEKVYLLGISPLKAHDHLLKKLRLLQVPYSSNYHFLDVFTNYAWAKYDQRVPENWGDIEFHPTYEGKMMKYLKEHRRDLLKDSCFWIVGGEARYEAMPGLVEYEKEATWQEIKSLG